MLYKNEKHKHKFCNFDGIGYIEYRLRTKLIAQHVKKKNAS